MTLTKFEALVKEVLPNFNIKQRGYGDIVGCFNGRKYILRLSKGHIPLNTYRKINNDPSKHYLYEKLVKRGRASALDMMVKSRLLTRNQATKIKWGLSCINHQKKLA